MNLTFQEQKVVQNKLGKRIDAILMNYIVLLCSTSLTNTFALIHTDKYTFMSDRLDKNHIN